MPALLGVPGLPAVRQVLLFMVINLALDLALLWFAARVARVRYRTWRLWVAALLGSVLALVPMTAARPMPAAWPVLAEAPALTPGPAGSWLLSGAAVVAGSALLVLLLIWPGTWPQFAAVFGFFWTGLIAAGGLLFLLQERYPALFTAPPAALVAGGVGVALGGVHLLWQAHRERAEVDDMLYEVEVRVGERRAVLEGLLDSGNLLRTPVSRLPVAVVDCERLRDCLPQAVVEAARVGPQALDRLPAAWQGRCQLVPYAAVGRGDGLLLVVRPDGLSVRPSRRGDWVAVEGQIGLAVGPLDPEGRYAALLPAAMAAEAQQPRPGQQARHTRQA